MERIARLETLARAGYAARGIVYLLLGYLALSSGASKDTSDVFQRIQDVPGGTIVLALTALGLIAYGLFRLIGGWLDLDGKGSDAGGWFQRAGQIASGLGHFLLAFAALRLAFGGGGGQGSSLSSLPDLIVILIGALVVIAGLGNLLEAWRASFRRVLDSRAPNWTHYAGRAGYAARGLVFILIGWQLLAGTQGQPGTESAMKAISEREWLFTAVAAGLFLFGLFSLIMAVFARIRDENVVRRLRESVARR